FYSILLSHFYRLFSFQCSHAHRHLHSFPTRRSSDLMSDVGGLALADGLTITLDDSALTPLPDAGPIVSSAYQPTNIDERTCVRRSEEHTSELQSRGHLVCRLLLEKKKKNTKK